MDVADWPDLTIRSGTAIITFAHSLVPGSRATRSSRPHPRPRSQAIDPGRVDLRETRTQTRESRLIEIGQGKRALDVSVPRQLPGSRPVQQHQDGTEQRRRGGSPSSVQNLQDGARAEILPRRGCRLRVRRPQESVQGMNLILVLVGMTHLQPTGQEAV